MNAGGRGKRGDAGSRAPARGRLERDRAGEFLDCRSSLGIFRRAHKAAAAAPRRTAPGARKRRNNAVLQR